MSKAPLVIFGDSAFAEIAFEYFTHDSSYEVRAFTVERDHLKKDQLFGKPIVPFEEMERLYPPATHSVFVAVAYGDGNHLRERLYHATKRMGYRLATYVSSKAFVWRNVKMGENCFIFENNVVQPFVSIGDNVVAWSGNHIGHHSKIGSHTFLASHVVISGFCEVGQRCFFGVNSTVGNNVKVGDDCVVGAGALIIKDVPAKTVLRGHLAAVKT